MQEQAPGPAATTDVFSNCHPEASYQNRFLEICLMTPGSELHPWK